MQRNHKSIDWILTKTNYSNRLQNFNSIFQVKLKRKMIAKQLLSLALVVFVVFTYPSLGMEKLFEILQGKKTHRNNFMSIN